MLTEYKPHLFDTYLRLPLFTIYNHLQYLMDKQQVDKMRQQKADMMRLR